MGDKKDCRAWVSIGVQIRNAETQSASCLARSAVGDPRPGEILVQLRSPWSTAGDDFRPGGSIASTAGTFRFGLDEQGVH
jgi:hypothetical protein